MQTTITGYSIIKELYQTPRSAIFQALQADSLKPVLIKTTIREYPTPEEIARFRSEFQVIRKLDTAGIVKAIDLVKHGNQLSLILEDFGGKPLTTYLAGGIELKSFFTISIKLGLILESIHQQRIIHRNINPSNIYWNPVSEEVKLMDFENSTELTQEQKNDTIPKLLEGSLPYISPEQTGRMNRDVDYLTDYYSLGATLYELLTGQHAFEAEDTMGWIYCHITKIPVDPGKINPNVPKMVSDIVLKLMAKNPEDRYQSMQGLVKDLVKCQRQWSKNRSIHQFTLGEGDYSDKFQIPQKLYGREAETDSLMSAFQKAASGKTELLLIAGFSGIGKSALVNEIRIPILQNKGYFIEGENDQLKRNQPYNAITMAFHRLIRRLLAEPNQQLAAWKNALQEVLEPNGQIILDIIPELEKIIGKQPPLQNLNPTEAHNRFLITFRKFVRIFATADHPLAIFLDDLQWTDISTLDLITDLVRQENLYLLVIGSYRNNEVSDNHPLMAALDEIQKSKFVKRLFLKPLKEDSVTRLIKDTLHCTNDQAWPLSELIFSKTGGNPFFVKELLKELHKDDFIRFDHATGAWFWELDKIRGLQVSDNVVRFVINRLKRLPQDTQKTLELASCIGNTFELKTLGLISEQSLPQTAQVLWEAIKQGILIPLDDRYRLVQNQDTEPGVELSDFGVQYRFSHDRIQQAIYSLIEAKKKQTVHLSIGRLMIKEYSAAEIELKLVDILFQLNEGRSLIREEDESYELVRLNLAAGKKAKSSTAYQAAYQYLKTGLECLPEKHWQEQYPLTFELAKEYSECAYLCGEFKQADEQCVTLLYYAKTKLEKAEILRMQSLQYTIRGELEKAIQIGVQALSLLGVKLSDDPSRAAIARELLVAKFNLGSRKIPDLSEQPVTTDTRIRTILKMLIELGAPAYLLGRDRLFAATVLKGINIILKHGNTPEAPMCYVPYGFLLGAVIGDWKSGYEFGKLGYELNERFNNLELKSKVIFFYTVFVHAWNRTWRTIPAYLKKAIEAGYQSGDLFYLAYSAVQIIPWDPDLDLETAVQQGEYYLGLIKESKYEDAWYSAKMIQQMRLNLRGLTHDQLSFNTASFNETSYLTRNKTVGFVPGVALYHLYKLQISYFYEDYQSAIFHAGEAEKPMNSMFGLPYTVEYCLYSFLAAAAEHSRQETKDKNLSWKRVKKEYGQMKKWADHCPENFSHHLLIMEAELARITGRNNDAIDFYNQAISAAQTNGFLRYEALANELAGKYFLAQNQPKIAGTYMKDALYCYSRWGAIGKVNQLKKDYARLYTREDFQEKRDERIHKVKAGPNETNLVSGGTETLDLNTISKASQTLSGEVVLEKLLNKLMYIVRENAGADKVILVLKEEGTGNLLIQAESTGDNTTVVMQSQPLEQNENCSVAIAQFVARTLESVVLKDATRQGDFIHDLYISKNQPKSILCLPIINQGILVGVLYLENNLSTDAFTPDRLKVLGLLSSQTAISIQNAVLYRTMEQKVVERTREITELLDNTGQGFLTFDDDFRIHKQHSRACELFFGRMLVDKTLNLEKGIDFIELIIQDPKEQSQLKKLFEAILSEKVSLEAIVQFFPEEITIEHRILSLEYKLIHASQPQLKNRIMVILTDVTREKELAEQLEKDEERNTTILQIVKDRQGFLAFMKSFTTSFRNIENTLKKEPEAIDVDKLFRYFHTIKGGAANFALNPLVEEAHQIESILYDVRTGEIKLDIDLIYKIKRRAIQLERDFRQLSADYGNFIPEEDTVYMESVYKVPQSKIDRHRQFLLESFGNQGFDQIQASINDICKQPVKTALRGFEISAQSLAKELGKRITVESKGEKTEILFDRLNHLLSSFIHLVRNAIDHGLEPPEERLKLNKPELGLLKIEVEEKENRLFFNFEDDGRGIDEETITALALKSKLVNEAWVNSASRQDKLNLVFLPGFSSKTEVSQLSGRGVGMDVVKAVVEELSGTIALSSELGKGTRISISIPAD